MGKTAQSGNADVQCMYVQHTCAFEMNFLNATPSVCIQEELGKKGSPTNSST